MSVKSTISGYIELAQELLIHNNTEYDEEIKTVRKSILTYIFITLTAILNIGCSLRVLEQPPETVIEEKSNETIFTVVDTTDIENPILTNSIRIPYPINPDNNVVLSGNHAYVTTENHLHTIDISNPQQPVYLKSLEFESQIGKVVVFDNLLVVGSPNELHFIDILDPSQPVHHVTKHLTSRNPINDYDVWDVYLYVMGENNTLYIFTKEDAQIKHIRTAKMSDRRWLIYPKNASQMVEQVKYSTSQSSYPHELSQGLLTNRYFLQIKSSNNATVRSSSAFVGAANLNNSTGFSVYTAGYGPRGNNPSAIRTGQTLVDIHRDYLDYLSSQNETTNPNRNPDDTIDNNASTERQQFLPVSSNKTIDRKDKQFMGPITDFQISDNLLFVLNAKGYLSILRLSSIGEEFYPYRPNFLSRTSLQGNHPKSIAVSENQVYIIATPESLQSGLAK